MSLLHHPLSEEDFLHTSDVNTQATFTKKQSRRKKELRARMIKKTISRIQHLTTFKTTLKTGFPNVLDQAPKGILSESALPLTPYANTSETPEFTDASTLPTTIEQRRKPIFSLPQPWLTVLSLVIAILGWGWAWVGIRSAMFYYEPGQLALGRYIVASLTLLPFWLIRGVPLPAYRDIPYFITMGLTGFTFYNFCINLGEKTVTAGTASLIGASLPIFTSLGAWFFFHEKLSFRSVRGIFLALAGVFLTTVGTSATLFHSKGAFLIIFAEISASVYALLIKKMIARYPPLMVTTWSIFLGTIGFIPFGHGTLEKITSAPWDNIINLFFLGMFPGAICYVLFSFALARASMAHVASSLFFIPITSITLGWLLLGELPSWLSFIGGMITLAGAYLVNTRKTHYLFRRKKVIS